MLQVFNGDSVHNCLLKKQTLLPHFNNYKVIMRSEFSLRLPVSYCWWVIWILWYGLSLKSSSNAGLLYHSCCHVEAVGEVTECYFWGFLHSRCLSSAIVVFLGRPVHCLLLATPGLSFSQYNLNYSIGYNQCLCIPPLFSASRWLAFLP